MRLGIIADQHLGYTHGTKTNKEGINQREQDVYDASIKAVDTLLENNVDAIVDAGDLAHVPAPKKRALLTLFNIMERTTPIQFYSANGNHTLVRTSSDVHLYDVLADRCDNFHGYTKPTFVEEVGGYFVPYSINIEQLKLWIYDTPSDAAFIVGHWACDDVPWPGEHILSSELPDIPVLLGHYHTRKVGHPTYIGSIERFAWGEHNNPTGVAIFDTENQNLEFIEITTREWVNLSRTPEDYLDIKDINDKIVRVTIEATQQQYHQLDMVKLRKKLDKSLEYLVRRREPSTEIEIEIPQALLSSLTENWKQHLLGKRMPHGVGKREVEELGLAAIGKSTG